MINKKAYLLLSFLFILPFSFNAFLQSPIAKLQIIIPDSNEDLTCVIYYETTNKTINNLSTSLTNGKTVINNPAWYNSGIQHTGLVTQCPPYYGSSIIVSSIKQEETSKFTIQNIYNPEDIDIDNDGVLDLREDETSILDNCLFAYNPEQSDCDNDNTGDVCDLNSLCSTDLDLDGIFDDEDTCRLTPNLEGEIDQIYTQIDSEWYGCSPSERDLDEDNICDGPLDLTSNYNNQNILRCSPGPDFCPGITGTYCKGCPNFCEPPAGKTACTTISCDTSNRLEPPTCNQLQNSCGTNQCTSNDNYCTEGSDGFYYCTPPTQEQICVSDENNQHGYCMDTECLVPDEQFDLFCEKEQECVNDNDNDSIPNILDCNPNNNTIGKCTGCSTCSEQECVPSDSLCESTICSNGCGTGDLIEFNITYVGTSIFNPEISLPNTCSISSSNNSGVCSQKECQIQTKTYSKTCDPDWDNDKICNGNVSVTNICSISPTGKDECLELAGSNSVIGCPDVDNDGIHDGIDICPYTYSASYIDYEEYPSCKLLDNGCISNDTDRDGVCDELEKKECIKSYLSCNYINDGVNNVGCILDADSDKVCNPLDKCNNTLSSCNVDDTGCPLCTNTSCFDPICSSIVKCESDNETICNAYQGCYWSNSTCTQCGISTLCSSYLTQETCKEDSCSVRNCIWFNEQCIQKSTDDSECDYDYDCETDETCKDGKCTSLSCIEDQVCNLDETCNCIDCIEDEKCASKDYDNDGYTNSDEIIAGTDPTSKTDYPKTTTPPTTTTKVEEKTPKKKSTGLWWKVHYS